MRALLDAALPVEVADELAGLVKLGLQPAPQHQELWLTDVKHLLSRSALFPACDPDFARLAAAGPLAWHDFPAGIIGIGHDGDGFCFDNELPRHRQFLEPYALASRLVTNGEYAGFIAAGGYEEPAFWLAEGWDWVRTQRLTQPIYWVRDSEDWHEFTLAGMAALDPEAPALHLSYFEASAYACFAGARLPTEAEWEHAARTVPLAQGFDVAWQWTSSSYAPYPGFSPAPGALGEYNGKFMVNQYVLRGGSLATPPGHSRASYRNFFPAAARWQFSGMRLAR